MNEATVHTDTLTWTCPKCHHVHEEGCPETDSVVTCAGCGTDLKLRGRVLVMTERLRDLMPWDCLRCRVHHICSIKKKRCSAYLTLPEDGREEECFEMVLEHFKGTGKEEED